MDSTTGKTSCKRYGKHCKFSDNCWHISCHDNNKHTEFTEIEHTKDNACTLRTCRYGEDCNHFKYIYNSNGRKKTEQLNECIDHCLEFSHKKLKTVANSQKIAYYLHSESIDNEKIKEILLSDGFNINYTEEKRNDGCRWTDKYQTAQFDAGVFNFLSLICEKCDYETFRIALRCRNVKIDACTLMRCVLKKDLKYIELIGLCEYSKHSKLRVPIGTNDPRISGDYNNVVNYLNVDKILLREDFSNIAAKFREWNLYL
jgi:hypothetical protein